MPCLNEVFVKTNLIQHENFSCCKLFENVVSLHQNLLCHVMVYVLASKGLCLDQVKPQIDPVSMMCLSGAM